MCVCVKFLETSLRHRSEMVMYEAARAICNLPGVEMNDLSPAINVLQVHTVLDTCHSAFLSVPCSGFHPHVPDACE